LTTVLIVALIAGLIAGLVDVDVFAFMGLTRKLPVS
jgi:hypothetical protein